MPGGENQYRLRKTLANLLESLDHHLLFPLMGGPGNKNSFLVTDPEEPPHLFLEDWLRRERHLVEFTISVDQDLNRVSAHGNNSFSVLNPNHRHGVKVVQDTRPEKSSLEIPLEGALGDPAVDQQGFSPLFLYDPQKIRPEFSLRNYKEIRS